VPSTLIVNPVAGGNDPPDVLAEIHLQLSPTFGAIETVMTDAPGAATEAATAAVRTGAENIFVAGGDGTLNEVLLGISAVPDGFARTTIGVIPVGTGNDFARALGFSEGVEHSLPQLATRQVIAADLAFMNGRPFVNVSGGGFIAEVSDAVDSTLKSIAGRVAYIIGGARVLLEWESVRTHVRTQEGDDHTAPLQMFAVCNSRMFGGGSVIAPHALIDDGKLDVCLVEDMSTPEFLSLLARVREGDHLDDPHVHYFRTSGLALEFAREIKVNTDGEPLPCSRAEYTIQPRLARFFANPAEMDAAVAA
jgi:diacylglycerol kinase (ATP)